VPSDSFQLRAARPEDADALVGLLAQLGYPDTAAFMARRLAEQLGHADAWLRVAADGSRVLGFISLHFMPQLALAGDFCRVSYLCVGEGARDRGIGEALLAAAEQEARRRGCDRMELHCDQRRTAAHRFYERLGYSDAPRYYRKALD